MAFMKGNNQDEMYILLRRLVEDSKHNILMTGHVSLKIANGAIFINEISTEYDNPLATSFEDNTTRHLMNLIEDGGVRSHDDEDWEEDYLE
jgi:hypothetical protein